MQLELTVAQHDVLLDLLRTELGRLKAEINRTETTAFRDGLKGREALLHQILDRLESSA